MSLAKKAKASSKSAPLGGGLDEEAPEALRKIVNDLSAFLSSAHKADDDEAIQKAAGTLIVLSTGILNALVGAGFGALVAADYVVEGAGYKWNWDAHKIPA